MELRIEQPILDLRRFRGNFLFILSNLTTLIQYVATFAVTFLLSLYLQVVHGISPQSAGLILLGRPVVMAVLSPLSGWFSDRVEPRVLASLGILLTGGSLWTISAFDAATSVSTVVGILLLMGLGFALFSSPNTNAVMGSVAPPDYGVAASILGTMRSMGQSFSMAVMLLLFTVYVGQVQISPEVVQADPHIAEKLIVVMRIGFRAFSGLSVVGLVASLARGRLRG